MAGGVLSLWWVWVGLGIALGILEMLLPAWLFAGFALGAVGTGAIIGLGLPGAGWMAASPANPVMAFALMSLAGWIALRYAFGKPGGSVKRIDHDVNEG